MSKYNIKSKKNIKKILKNIKNAIDKTPKMFV